METPKAILFSVAYKQLLIYVRENLPSDELNYFVEWEAMMKDVFELSLLYVMEHGDNFKDVPLKVAPILAEMAYLHLAEDNAFEIMVRMAHASIAFNFFVTWIIIALAQG